MSKEQPRSRRELRQARDERVDVGEVDAGAEPGAAETAGRSRRVADGPADAVPAGAERSSQARARDRATLRTIKELAEKEGHLAGGGEPTRRQLRLMQLAAETAPATSANAIVPAPQRTRSTPPAAKPGTADIPVPPLGENTVAVPRVDADPLGPAARGVDGMTVEQALAARESLVAQARNHVAQIGQGSATDPDAVDPAVLAEQIALAERAAVLNRRAAAKQKLADQTSQTVIAPRNDPTTANNLAMVTPLEFEQVPGVDRPVMKRPATSYVPVVTNSGPRIEAPGKTGPRRGGPARKPREPGAGPSGVLARAEAAAKAAAHPTASGAKTAPGAETPAGPPVAANAAHGLDPLDAATAGLGRAHRMRLIQLGILVLGALALIAGISLIVIGLAR